MRGKDNRVLKMMLIICGSVLLCWVLWCFVFEVDVVVVVLKLGVLCWGVVVFLNLNVGMFLLVFVFVVFVINVLVLIENLLVFEVFLVVIVRIGVIWFGVDFGEIVVIGFEMIFSIGGNLDKILIVLKDFK